MSTLADYAMPPYDGTGMPPEFWPAASGGTSTRIVVYPGDTETVAHDDAEARPGVTGAWLPGEGATFSDGVFSWDGTQWVAGAVPAPAPPAPQQADASEYDPSEHTVTEVQAYISEHPDEADAVLDRERAGKARTSLIGA